MTKEEFKNMWEGDEQGSGITFNDVANCAKEWGLYSRPKCANILEVRYAVLKVAECIDAEDYNPNEFNDDEDTDNKDTNDAYIEGYNEAIEKAVEWLAEETYAYDNEGNRLSQVDLYEFITNFKRAMKL